MSDVVLPPAEMPHEPSHAVRVGRWAVVQLLIHRAIRCQLYLVGGALEKPHDDLVDSDLLAAHSGSPLVVAVLTVLGEYSLQWSRPTTSTSQHVPRRSPVRTSP